MFLFLLCLLAPVVSSTGVQIVGLFPKEDPYEDRGLLQEQERTAWCRHCVAMFRAAITVADQRGIRVNGTPISSIVLETSEDDYGFGTLDKLCQLITNNTTPDIVGIVGPSSSAETRVLGPFAARIGLPLVSYAATTADLSDSRLFPTFYRTIPSDELLVKAIVQLFHQYFWKACTVIFQKDDYGYGGVRILSENYGNDLTIRERVTFDAPSDRFNVNLTKTLEKSRSRIVLVWANESTSTRIVQYALEEGLIGGSYVWVMTDKVDLSEFNNCGHWRLLEGLLTVMPMESHPMGGNQQLLLEARAAWANSSSDNKTLPNIDQPVNSFAMFTFDAAWTLIEALNKSSSVNPPLLRSSPDCFNGVLENKVEYHRYLKETNFSGVSGNVQFSNNFSNNRVCGGYYVLTNLQLTSSRIKKSNGILEYKPVMMWDETKSKWLNLTGPIRWPNRSDTVPSEHPRIRGDQLHILVIEAPPFVIVRNLSSPQQNANSLDDDDPFIQQYHLLATKDPNITIYGFVADLICKLQEHMGFTYTIDVVEPGTSYHSLVELLAENGSIWDVIISDVTITSNRMQTVDFSLPVHENAVRVIVRDNPSLFELDFFSFLSPFSTGVWLLILLLIMYSGVLMYIFERRALPKDEKSAGLRAVASGVFHVLSRVVSMSGDLSLTTMSSRMIKVGLYTVSVILVATYTANLSSFLTFQRTLPSISGIDDIKNGRVPFSRIGILTNTAISDFYLQNISSSYFPISKIQDVYYHLLANDIDAALSDSAILEYAIDHHYCGQLIVVGIGFAKSSFGIAMRKNWKYKADFDKSILSFRESDTLETLEKRWLRQRKCTRSVLLSNFDKDAGMNEKGKIPIDILTGLFLTFSVTSIIALALHLWHFRVDISTNIRRVVMRVRQRLVWRTG